MAQPLEMRRSYRVVNAEAAQEAEREAIEAARVEPEPAGEAHGDRPRPAGLGAPCPWCGRCLQSQAGYLDAGCGGRGHCRGDGPGDGRRGRRARADEGEGAPLGLTR